MKPRTRSGRRVSAVVLPFLFAGWALGASGAEETAIPSGGFVTDARDVLLFPVVAVQSADGRVRTECGSGGGRLGWGEGEWVERTDSGTTIARSVAGGLAFEFHTAGGFTDPTPVAPVGGNPGTTLGEQRSVALAYAAELWGGVLQGSVPIRVDIAFQPGASFPFCTAGFSRIDFVFRDFPGAPLSHTWYFEALANTLRGADQHAGDDFLVRLNADYASCSGIDFYYGLDGNPPSSQLDFVTLVLHEIGHGLGFAAPFVVYQNGSKLLGLDDVYTLHLENHATGRLFPAMTDGERFAASHGSGDLHWVGPGVVSGAASLTSGVDPSGHVEMQTVIPASPSIDHFRTTLFPDELMEPFLGHAIHDPGLAGALLVDLGWKRTTMSSCLQCGRDEAHDGVAVCHVPPGNPPNPRELRIAPSALRAHCEHGDSCGPCDDGGTKDASAPDP